RRQGGGRAPCRAVVQAQTARMPLNTDSQLPRVRALLAPRPVRGESFALVAAAAAFFAISALTLAVVVVMTPTPWPM
ncbi:MAG TPA: hypothetical protein VFE13_08445, partial [Caulobacteraceae bacterium]|nr:hypothetical protein [Caulobacteraceae bacterium]